ncbi:hypothetical protein C1D09_007325 [Mesorhizobium intechi]|uniref:Uncharacterized protein n=1 Tax=Mesorhizobium intechi TaxID=537601 RepID=A0A8T9AUW9_9HYPH|nr:hypothetical protein [Mesorhizobium intechi]TSE12786.1 hypothetical protein C1D09_007325 [Mesorhizobium intechi]
MAKVAYDLFNSPEHTHRSGADLGAFRSRVTITIILQRWSAAAQSSPRFTPSAFCWSHAAWGRLTAQKYCTPGMQISGSQSISDNILLAITSPP